VYNVSFTSNLKLFMALSRTAHGVLDLATPTLSALLWLGTFPSPYICAVGFVTALAGYTAVYALNDLVDCAADKARVERGGGRDATEYLDSVFVRHPVAKGLMSFRKGVLWATGWGLIALTGAFLLNPVCALIFLFSVCMETIYCRMLQVSHLRVVVSGVVKTLGGIAAVFAVDPAPSLPLLALLFFWLFFWEIGGQNIPCDWFDVEEDALLGFRTIPVRLGPGWASFMILFFVAGAVLLSAALLYYAPGRFSFPLVAGSLVIGLYFLLIPAYRLYRNRALPQIAAFFNKSSYYPAALLGATVAHILLVTVRG
jgi:4-hydroxybenzoate polyprenyltransferase